MKDYIPANAQLFRDMRNDPLMTTAEVAIYARVAVNTVANWAADGKLKGIKTPSGGRWRFRLSEVIAAMEAMESGR